MRVLQVIDQLNTGGAEKMLVNISNLMVDEGHSVDVLFILSSKGSPLEKQLKPSVGRINLYRKWKWDFFVMKKMIILFKHYEIIHVHSSHNLRYVLFASFIFNFNRAIVYHEHFGGISKRKFNFNLLKLLLKSVFVITNSKEIYHWAKSRIKFDNSRLFYIPNFVLPASLNGNSDWLTLKIKNVIIVSNFLPVKNIEFALEVFALIFESDAILTIVGKNYDNNYFNVINQRVINLGLANRVVIINNCENTYDILNKFDFALHTSFSESGPLVLAEYLAHGLPFMAYNTGEVAKTIQSNIPEMIIDNFILNDWQDKFYMIDSSSKKLKLELVNVFKKKYSPEVFYKSCIETYKKCKVY
jgi:glycosyltransferase involved in cell wall biosynthesis